MLPSALIPKASVEEAPGTSMLVKPWSCAKPLLTMQMANSRARPRVVKRRVLVMSMVDSFPSVLSISLQLRSQDPARSRKTISYAGAVAPRSVGLRCRRASCCDRPRTRRPQQGGRSKALQGVVPTREGKGNGEALPNVGHGLQGYVEAGSAQVTDLGVTAACDPLEVAGLHKRDPVKRGDSLPNLRQALCWHLVANLEATPSDPRSWKRRRAAPLSHLASLAALKPVTTLNSVPQLPECRPEAAERGEKGRLQHPLGQACVGALVKKC